MSWTDILLAGGLIAGALYLLYRSIWKKQGFCPGCDAHTCGSRQRKTDKGEKSW